MYLTFGKNSNRKVSKTLVLWMTEVIKQFIIDTGLHKIRNANKYTKMTMTMLILLISNSAQS